MVDRLIDLFIKKSQRIKIYSRQYLFNYRIHSFKNLFNVSEIRDEIYTKMFTN